MYIKYSCKDEGICDTHCPNKDCIYHKTNIKGELTNDTNNNNANSGRQIN